MKPRILKNATINPADFRGSGFDFVADGKI